jgi:hypothetical protein
MPSKLLANQALTIKYLNTPPPSRIKKHQNNIQFLVKPIDKVYIKMYYEMNFTCKSNKPTIVSICGVMGLRFDL